MLSMKPKRIFRRRSLQRGMQLLEVMVSVLIFSIGLLGMVALYARSIQDSVNAEDRTRAALLADEIVNTMWTSGTLNLPPAVLTAWQAKVAPAAAAAGPPKVTSDITNAHLPSGSGTVAVDPTTSTATITIEWQAPSASEKSRLVTQVGM